MRFGFGLPFRCGILCCMCSRQGFRPAFSWRGCILEHALPSAEVEQALSGPLTAPWARDSLAVKLLRQSLILALCPRFFGNFNNLSDDFRRPLVHLSLPPLTRAASPGIRAGVRGVSPSLS